MRPFGRAPLHAASRERLRAIVSPLPWLTLGSSGSTLLAEMSIPRTIFRLALALALLLFGVPLGAIEAPVAPNDQAGAAGPIWFSSGLETPAAPESGASREAPECSVAAASGDRAAGAGSRPGHAAAREAAALSARTPLYLSHCVFRC